MKSVACTAQLWFLRELDSVVLVVESKLLDLKVMEALKQVRPLVGPAVAVLES
jgi:hypothetical protein